MIFDSVKRFLGLGGNQRPENERPQNAAPPIDSQIMPYREQMPPDISQIESEISQIHKFMEHQMRSMMGSFGFTFSSPFSGFEFEDAHRGNFPSSPFMPGAPMFPNEPAVPGLPESSPPALNPRDEVLKPQFRSRSSGQWNGQDQILDERVQNEGLGSIIDELKPSEEASVENNPWVDNFFPSFGHSLFRSSPFGNGFFSSPLGPESDSVMSSSAVTIYSNVNGHKSVEKIVRHPDGRIERTVVTNDGDQQH